MSLKIVSVSLLTTILLFSCAPKDEKLSRPDQNSKLKTNEFSSDDSVKLLAIAFDKEVEALHFMKASLNSDYAKLKNLNVQTVSESATKIVKHLTSVSANGSNDRVMVSDSNDVLQLSQVDLLATIDLVDGRIQRLEIKDDSAGQSTEELYVKDKGKKPTLSTLLVTNKLKHITVQKADADNTYSVDVDSVDALRTFNKKAPAEVYSDLSQVQAQMLISWDGKAESLNDKIKVLSTSVSHLKTAQNKMQAAMHSESDSELFVSLSECAALDGKIVMTTTKLRADSPVDKQLFQFDNSSLSVKEKTVFKAGDCASRPVVDLRKLL